VLPRCTIRPFGALSQVESEQRWLVHRRRAGRNDVALVCFPHAGGGVAAFRGWNEALPGSIVPYFVRLPGRETRVHEPPRERLTDLVEELLPLLRRLAAGRLALFGHSAGALIAFELAHALTDVGRPPGHLFLSALGPPHAPRSGRRLHELPTWAMLEELHRLGGMPTEALENPELLELVVPALRADLLLSESHVHIPRLPLACPISAFAGIADELVRVASVGQWARYTSGVFRLRRLRGGHFFALERPDVVCAAVAADLACGADSTP
jgi:medium-chain acyl-[acyl-carrier-protein] hydrolase